MIAAITLPAALGGCASNETRPPLAGDIGPPPPYLQPVAIPPAKAGDSPVIDARRLTGSLRQANQRITCAREDWEITRDRMLGGNAASRREDCAMPK